MEEYFGSVLMSRAIPEGGHPQIVAIAAFLFDGGGEKEIVSAAPGWSATLTLRGLWKDCPSSTRDGHQGLHGSKEE
jgi:hypothetical protein